MNILIPMAGLGDRFKKSGFNTIKPMIPIFSRPMIEWVIDTFGIDGNYIFILNNKNEYFSDLKDILDRIVPTNTIITVDYLTDGPVSTCLLAKDYINNDTPLLTLNCDQILTWDVDKFKQYLRTFEDDGFVVTYDTNTPKNSYVKIDSNGYAVEFAEKQIISTHSLNGIHYWAKGKDFVYSAEKMIKKDIRVNKEFYIAPTYNELIKIGKKIKTYHIEKTEHWSVGTPEDLDEFLEVFGIKKYKGSDMLGGWFVGNFNPSALQSKDFEVCYKLHKKGESWDTHYHKKAREVNYLIRGEMSINNHKFVAGDIFVIEPLYMATPNFLDDCELIVIKVPSVSNDKYVYHNE
jgi:dTDP-glucose pyrophosphorylase